jgi:FkbM family methyltransferase
MFSAIRDSLRFIPGLVPLWRRVRRATFPTDYDRWAIGTAKLNDFLKRVTKTESSPFFVKVGANDGLSGDPCGRWFVEHENWGGMLIEPVPYLFDRLKQNYPSDRFVLEQVAIGIQPGEVPFYFVSEEAKVRLPNLPAHFDMLGSFRRQHIVEHLDGVLEPFIVETKLQVETLKAVLRQHHIHRIEFLHIDVEGFDWEVLRSLDFDEAAPSAILIEHRHLTVPDRAQLESRLQQYGYQYYDCGNDFFAERR